MWWVVDFDVGCYVYVFDEEVVFGVDLGIFGGVYDVVVDEVVVIG